MVPAPWDEQFEAGWEAPQSALRGSLLRGPVGQYIATLEWASLVDCEAWLNDNDAMQAARSSTTIFKDCNSRRQETSVRQTGLASFDERSPNVDPRTLFAIAAGDAVDIAEEDEVLVSGGDPAFLDASKWPTPAAGSQVSKQSSSSSLDQVYDAAAVRATLLATYPSGSSGEDPESDDMTELLVAGGDPSFLDDKLWLGDKAQEEEWDGKEDDSAHLFD